MEIRQLHTFLQVAAIQNFTQAGRILGYSQSNISVQIQQLEREIGAPLFNRVGRHVTLTQYGEELIPYAQQIVSTAIRMENFLKSEEALGGTLRVGMVESLFVPLLRPVLERYHRRFPRVRIELTVDATASLKEQLNQGLVDLACIIDDPLPQTDWTCWHSVSVPVVIVCNPASPLAAGKALSLRDLADQEFILMEESASYSVHFQRLTAQQKLEIRPVLKLQSADMACRLVETGDFLSVLPMYSVRDAVEAGRVAILPVEDFSLSQLAQIVLHPGKIVIPQINGLLEELREAFDQVV